MKKTNRLPIDIALKENVEVAGALFVKLPTLCALQKFWSENKSHYRYAAQGIPVTGGQTYLNGYEWIFATTKTALVDAFTRWDQAGIRCEWYDWGNESEPVFSLKNWFTARDHYRSERMEVGKWTADDEVDYQADCKVRTPETYRGWWTLQNLPHGASFGDWLSGCRHIEIIDATLPLSEVKRQMQELTYESFSCNADDISVMDASGVEQEIEYWIEERCAGGDYYGVENEEQG